MSNIREKNIINQEINELKSVFLQAMNSTQKEELRKLARQSILDRFSIEKRGEALYKIINTLVAS